MKHIINFSGGKDSTAMTLKMLEDGWWVDEIIFADTGKDFPQMIGHINKFDDYIQKHFNKKITRIKAEKSFDYYMFEHEKQKEKQR